jgi:hypothetical protein
MSAFVRVVGYDHFNHRALLVAGSAEVLRRLLKVVGDRRLTPAQVDTTES